MKYIINKTIVVEGKEDASYLSSFIDAEFVMMNGYNIPEEEIKYLNKASQYKEILVLVDPDEAGRKIEEKLKRKLVKAKYLKIDIAKCIKGKKNGVAECDIEEILKTLKPYFENEKIENKPVFEGNLSIIDLNDKGLRQYLSYKFCLGICNTKKLIYRLSVLQIKEQDLMGAIKEYQRGN